ncbi:hypothetical protein ATER59S_02465 [Aquamicrobium terrae]
MNELITREIETMQRLFLHELQGLPEDMDSYAISIVAYNHIATLFRTVCILTGSIDEAVDSEVEFVSRIRELGERFEDVG